MRKDGSIFASEVLTYSIPNSFDVKIAVYVKEIEDYKELDASLKNRRMEQNLDVLSRELKREKRLRAQMMREKISESDSVYFDKYLTEHFPSLTSNDLKICRLLVKNLSSAEIADRLSITKEGVFAARKRLRKKLKLETGTDLIVYLQRVFGDMLSSK